MRILKAETKSLLLSDLYSTYPLIELTKEDFPTPVSPISAILNSSTPRRSSSSSFGIKPMTWPMRLNMTKTEIYDCLKEIKVMKSRRGLSHKTLAAILCSLCTATPSLSGSRFFTEGRGRPYKGLTGLLTYALDCHPFCALQSEGFFCYRRSL